MTATASQPPLLVLGAGIAGITTALEAAETGREVVLVEKEPAIGGRVAKLHNYFPKMCPPSCGLEINTRRLEQNPRIRLLTDTTVTRAERQDGGWKVTLKTAPQYIKSNCTECGDCSKACDDSVADPFNLGMAQAPVARAYKPDPYPRRFVLDKDAARDGGKAVAEACKVKAVDLDASATEQQLEVGAMVLATGWHPYPLEKLPELGGGLYPDVIANVMLERLASPSGPTAGKILRPSDGEPPRQVAFVQCAGSRDVNHLPYCSGVCCLASLKQAAYVKEQLPEAEVTIYYIDRRTPGRNEEVLTRTAEMDGVRLVKGKVGKVEATGKGFSLRVEDVEQGKLLEAEADLVVLATGMVSNLRDDNLPIPIPRDDDGFGVDSFEQALFVAGVARRPEDVAASVRDATGAAAKAMVAGRRA